ncbi:MAG TPA: VWA domain-containing protein [Blastocatellia bacterium]|nr:VWA domain-containing protein [Blastocatellia bacterium]
MNTAQRGKSLTCRCLQLLCVHLCLTMLAVAQSGRKPQQKPGEQQPKPGDAPTVRIETREVVLPLTAYDADGKYIDDLQPKDVLVLEEGEARQVTALKREPANIVLILDLANEIGTFKNAPTERYGKPDTPIWEKGPAYKPIRRPTQSEFAAQFISNLSPNDKLAIIQYAEKPQLIQDWTSDRNQALNALSSKYRVGIRSSYHDALKLAADKLEAQPNGRRIVVLITDGLDSSSKTGKSKAIQALEKARATMFIIGWAEALRREIEIAIGWIANHEVAGTNAQKRIEELRRHVKQLDGAAVELNSLAENSGGGLWLPPTHEALILSNRTVSQEIGAQYSLSFVTENTPSLEDKRSIQVLPARPGLSVRSRRSYYISEEPKALTR